VQVRLAVWQLERLQERRDYNARVQAQLDQPPLTLETRTPGDDLSTMEYRSVVVRGEFDFTQGVALPFRGRFLSWSHRGWRSRPRFRAEPANRHGLARDQGAFASSAAAVAACSSSI
jgi:hypothetical protein